jgi:hypothetical protein
MPDLKPITPAGIPAALLKANRYRLLNDSSAAESICADILAIEPENAEAIVLFLLAITDQFPDAHPDALSRAREAAQQLRDPYKRAYYHGIICERWGMSLLHREIPRAAEMAYDWIVQAMHWFEQAEAMRPEGNDESILRWNTCVRLMQANPQIQPAPQEAYEPSFE